MSIHIQEIPEGRFAAAIEDRQAGVRVRLDLAGREILRLLDGKLLPIRRSPSDFDRVMEHCIRTHCARSEYLCVDGGAYFSICALEEFVKQLGGPEKARDVLEAARKKVAAAGLGKVHFAAFTSVPQSIPVLRQAGSDSMTSYKVTTMAAPLRLPEQPFERYDAMIERHERYWDAMDTGELPYRPVVTVGWDVSPRWEKGIPWPPEINEYPYTPIVVENTPEKFGDLLRRALRHAASSQARSTAVFINAWNDWTEGGILLPEERYSTGFLEEVRKAASKGR